MKPLPAIVLSTHTTGIGVIRALGSMGVPIVAVYYRKNDMGYVSKYVIDRIYAPHPERYEDQFVGLLVEKANIYGGGLLIPADDETLTVTSRHKKTLEKHYVVACAEYEIIRKVVDKKYTYRLAESIGVRVPKTAVPESLSDVKNYAVSVDYPCLVKPCESHKYFEAFKKKMVLVNGPGEMLETYRHADKLGIGVMFQEYIPGDDTHGVNYNSYFYRGEPMAEFTAEKVRMSPPGFGVPRVVVSKEIPEIIEPGRKFLRALGYYGYSCTEFKRDPRDEQYRLMEVNGRHNRSAMLAVRCGVNFPWMEYNYLINGEIEGTDGYLSGTYWIDEFRDLIHGTRYLLKERYKVKQQLAPYVNSHVYAVFDSKDPMPFLKRCLDIACMPVTRLLGPSA